MKSRTIYLSSLLLILSTSVNAGSDFKWIDDKKDSAFNCAGKVADAVCCKDNFCDVAKSESDCRSGNKQFLCSWTNGKCSSFRDVSNNVCCQSEVKDACDKVVRGICPADWQVPENCCSGLNRKWNGTLVGVKPGFVCCNAPCAEMQKAGCALPNSCAPSQRSLISGTATANPYSRVGFNPNYYGQQQAQNIALGNILSGTGFGGDYGTAVLGALGDGKSKGQQVDEITVDDLMSMLIDSLSGDKDAMVSNTELNSDPYLGKIKSGGNLAGFNFPDANIFLDQIYGNPFGMSGGNLGSYPSLPNFYAQSMLGLPTPPAIYGSSPHYPPQPQYGAYPAQPQYGGYPAQPQYGYPQQTPYPSPAPYSQPQYTPQPQPSQYQQPQYTQSPQYPQPTQYGQPQQYQQPPQYTQQPQYQQPQPTQYTQQPQYQQPQPTQYGQPQQSPQYTQQPQYQQPQYPQPPQYGQPQQYQQPPQYTQQPQAQNPQPQQPQSPTPINSAPGQPTGLQFNPSNVIWSTPAAPQSNVAPAAAHS